MAGDKGAEGSSDGVSGPPGVPAAAISRTVFLSYASADAVVANQVCEYLESHGVPCWMAPRDVKPGAQYADAIVRAINDAKALVLVLSQSAVASLHVGKEVERASSKRKQVIALKIDAAVLTPALEYFLSESQWIDVPVLGMPAALARLAEAVGQGSASTSNANSRSGSGGGSGESAVSRTVGAANVAKRVVVAAAVVVVGIALTLAVRFWPTKHIEAHAPAVATISDKSIAVLPFTDMSQKKDQEYFGDGMAEEIIDLLAKVPNLHIPARTSSFYFKGKPTKVPDIARELSVANVLEGSIRRSGNQLRVTAQLIRADSGFQVWSETYDRDLSDVFKVQDDIANAVVQALQITLMGGPLTRQKGGTQNLEAYQLYLRGINSEWQNTHTSIMAARDYFNQTIKLDPEFGLAWAELSRATILLTDDGVLLSKEGYESARQLAQHALQLSPDLAEAHAMLQYVHHAYDWDWAASEAEGRLALALDPTNPSALMFAGQLSYTLGRWDDAERQLRLALVRDPLFTIAIWSLGTAQYSAGRYADAEATYRKLMEIEPGFVWTRFSLTKVLLAERKPEAALALIRQEPEEENRLAILPIALQATGHQTEADAAFATLVTKYSDSDAYSIAMTYAYRDDLDRATQWLERAYMHRDISLVEIVGEPLFKNLKNDPRFKAFLKKMNLPE
jgi:TolB-like protein/tetratricopeptide (TPR) repeat protein